VTVLILLLGDGDM